MTDDVALLLSTSYGLRFEGFVSWGFVMEQRREAAKNMERNRVQAKEASMTELTRDELGHIALHGISSEGEVALLVSAALSRIDMLDLLQEAFSGETWISENPLNAIDLCRQQRDAAREQRESYHAKLQAMLTALSADRAEALALQGDKHLAHLSRDYSASLRAYALVARKGARG